MRRKMLKSQHFFKQKHTFNALSFKNSYEKKAKILLRTNEKINFMAKLSKKSQFFRKKGVKISPGIPENPGQKSGIPIRDKNPGKMAGILRFRDPGQP